MSEPSAITGLPDPHVAIHAVGMPATPSSIVKPFFFEDRRQVLRRLEFLEAELAEAEHRVVPLLDVFLQRVDLEADVALVLIQLRVRSGGRGRLARRSRRRRRRRVEHRVTTTTAGATTTE